jgi:hypothetical protein
MSASAKIVLFVIGMLCYRSSVHSSFQSTAAAVATKQDVVGNTAGMAG